MLNGETTRRTPAAVVVAIGWLLAAGCQSQDPAGPIEPMELQGRWLGMAIAGTESTSAQALGVPPVVKGVVVTELLQDKSGRAAQAGVQAGDVITAIDGKPVTNLAELYTLSTRQGTQKPLAIDLVRNGQPLRATLAASADLMAGVGAGATGAGGPQFYCPTDAVRWSHADVHPTFRCPRCGGPVTSVTQ